MTKGTALDRRQMLDRLIGFDTTSRNSNLALIEFVRDYLDRLGIASDLVFDDTGAKANLFATIGPPEVAGIVLSGHTDVVPVDGQDWSSDPFACIERDGRLYGRGTADMKGFIATVLALVPEFQALPLAAPVHLALSFDEEVGCKGVPRLLDHLVARLPALPFGCVVGEPTGMRLANGHKGKAGYVCTVTGLASHSALNHLGVNAIEVAARIIDELRRLNDEFRLAGPLQAELPAAPLHRQHRRDRRRQRAQHRARSLPLRVRVPALAGPGPGRAVRADPRLGGNHAACGDARGVAGERRSNGRS